MMPDPTFYRMVAQAHYEEMLREAEQRRLAYPPRPRRNTSRRTTGRLSMHFLKPGTWLKACEQLATAYKHLI